jgi:ABC-type multidrug transport system fused ATPase/permease subunit
VLGHAIALEKVTFTVAVVGSALFSALTIGSAYVCGEVIGRVAAPAVDHGRVDEVALLVGVVVILAVALGKVAGLFARRLGAGQMQFRMQARYRAKVTRRYLELPLRWHHGHATGTLLSNANADVEASFSPIAPTPLAVGTAAMLIGAILALFLTDWVLALVGLAVLPALFGVNIVYSRAIGPRVTRAQQLRAEVSAIAHESFDGALVVKTMGREEEETARFRARSDELRDAMIRVGRVRGLFDPFLDALPGLGTLAILFVGGYRLRAGVVSVADVVSAAFLFTVLAVPVRSIGYVLAELPRSVVGWERVQAVLNARGDMAYGDDGPPPTDPVALRFEGVDYHYADGPRVLHDISFAVPAGKTVALVGPTGSGKSTIAALAVRLMDPDAGRVELSGRDVRELRAEVLAGSASLVAQVPFLFDDTVRGNVILDRPGIGDADVARALRLAQADGFVAGLSDGADTTIGERGISLSGGQRQRVTLARALAGRPRLLVLDDATSAVDPRVESQILAALRAPQAGTSILVVAYRRATIALADEVVYLEQGRVVARGTHSGLLATVPGYADLVTAYERDHDAGLPAEDELADLEELSA